MNLSGRQFRQPDLAEMIEQSLAETGLAPARLALELTESTLLHHVEQSAAVLDRLHALGVAVLLDDFGTGYSSLAYLKRLPLSALKIDRSFVRDLTSDFDDAAIVTAIVTMAHNLGLGVIAEGVEMRAQLEFLRGLGTDAVQGYLFGRPQPAEESIHLIGLFGIPPRRR